MFTSYLCEEIEWEPWKQEVWEIFHNGKRGVDYPVDQPLSIVIFANALHGFNPRKSSVDI